MATTPKVLGQVKPQPNVDTSLVTMAAGKNAMVSTISVCNLGIYTTYRIAVRPAAETLEDKHYIAYECGIGPNTTDLITIGCGLGPGDVLQVRTAGSLAFAALGAEVS